MTNNDYQFTSPLRWPDGQARTRNQDRTGRKTWKASLSKVRDGLQLELGMLLMAHYERMKQS